MILKLYPHNEIIKKLTEGQSFGEIALESSSIRTSTVVCSKNCHLVSLSNDAY